MRNALVDNLQWIPIDILEEFASTSVYGRQMAAQFVFYTFEITNNPWRLNKKR